MGEDIPSINIQKCHALIVTKAKHDFQISVFTTLKEFSQQVSSLLSNFWQSIAQEEIALSNLTCTITIIASKKQLYFCWKFF